MNDDAGLFQCPGCDDHFEEGSSPDRHHERTCGCGKFLQWDNPSANNTSGWVTGESLDCRHDDRRRPGAETPIPVPIR